MTRVRRALGTIAVAWLTCQIATLVLAPTLLEISLADCSCPLGAGAACPMHHKTAAAGSKVCAMQSAATSIPATFNALFSVAGLLPAPLQASAPLPTAEIAPLFAPSMRMRRPSPPDPPPPRA